MLRRYIPCIIKPTKHFRIENFEKWIKCQPYLYIEDKLSYDNMKRAAKLIRDSKGKSLLKSYLEHPKILWFSTTGFMGTSYVLKDPEYDRKSNTISFYDSEFEPIPDDYKIHFFISEYQYEEKDPDIMLSVGGPVQSFGTMMKIFWEKNTSEDDNNGNS